MRKLLLSLIGVFVLAGCEPTYKRETMKQSIKELAKNEYQLEVDVEEIGDTMGLQFRVPNMLGELAAEDQMLAKQIDELILVLSRVVLSSDRPPKFIVLDVVDAENSKVHFMFTRYVDDIKKLMGERISRTQFTDRLLMEFVIGKKRIPFDPYEMDLIRLMLMGAEALTAKEDQTFPFELEEINYDVFLSKVIENSVRRLIREDKQMKLGYSLRQVSATFNLDRLDQQQFEILLDLVTQPAEKKEPPVLESRILPKVAETAGKIFKSYKFDSFSQITVVEKNSGKLFAVPGK